MQLKVNGQLHQIEASPETPLLWVLRDTPGLTGTKFGCGKMLCGACTVHLDGHPTRTCMLPVKAAIGRSITTIEGLSKDASHPLQKAWIAVGAPQCGYCQSGQIMTAAALLRDKPKPTDDDINEAMTNLCRCGTYNRIRKAIHLAASET